MRLLKQKRRKSKREKILLYTKPFTKRLLPLVATNDKRYIPSGGSYADVQCDHLYCWAERARAYMDSEEDSLHPVGLPWATGYLRYLPGHVKVVFPLRRNEKKPEKKKKKVAATPPPMTVLDKITNPEMCGAIDETLYAYKVFMIAGMIISEAEIASEDKEEEEKEDSEFDLT